jgi:DNA ligase-1
VDRILARTPSQLQLFLDSQVERGLEGIIAKRLDAPYEAGQGTSTGSNSNRLTLEN